MKQIGRKRSRIFASSAICLCSVSLAVPAHPSVESSANSWTASHTAPRSAISASPPRSNDDHAQRCHSFVNRRRSRFGDRRDNSKSIQETGISSNSKHIMCQIRGGEQSPQTPSNIMQPQPPPPPPPPPPPLPTTLTEVYENEIYSPEDQSWSAAGTAETKTVYTSSFARWTQPDGTPSPPPTTIAAPPGYEFADEWKIDVTGVGVSRDDLGWEYSWDGNGLGRRRRRWLRKLKVRRVEVRDAAEILREQREKEREMEPNVADTVDKETGASEGEPVTKAAAQSKRFKKVKAVEKATSTSSTTTVASRRASVRRSRTSGSYAGQFTRTLLRPIRDNWNFKGYGISVMKSLIFPSAGGVSLRLPLSINFDWYERRPELPSITSSATYYYSNSCPWMYALFLNASLPMELIRFCIRRFSEYTWFLAGVLWSTMLVLSDALWRILVFPATVLVRFASLMSDMALNDASIGSARKKERNKSKKKNSKAKKAKKGTVVILGQAFPRLPPPRNIVYSTVIQDRVGISASWRVSATRGYEFRISYWHWFTPTMLSVASAVVKGARFMLVLQENASRSKVPMKGRVGGDIDDSAEDSGPDSHTASVTRIDVWKRFAEPCEDWIQRKTGSVGFTWGGPIPEQPYLGASAVLSVSALYPTEFSRGLRNAVALLSPRTPKDEVLRKDGGDTKDFVVASGIRETKKKIEPEVIEIEEGDSIDDILSADTESSLSGEKDYEENPKVLAEGDDDDLVSDDSSSEDAELPLSTH